MQQNPGDFSMEEAMRFANSAQGQQLLMLLKQSNNPDLQKAMALAAKGDISQAKTLLKGVSRDPQIQKLFGNMGEQK